jgi:hypothetical protein
MPSGAPLKCNDTHADVVPTNRSEIRNTEFGAMLIPLDGPFDDSVPSFRSTS